MNQQNVWEPVTNRFPHSLRTVQDWEQGKRQPVAPAIALLRIAEQKPEVFMQLT